MSNPQDPKVPKPPAKGNRKVASKTDTPPTPRSKVSTKGNDTVTARRVGKIAKASAGVSFNTRVGTSGGGFSSNTVQSGAFNFFSPQLSTDFLELPQSLREKREWYRFYYDCLLPGTPVLMADQTEKPIEDVQVGERVINALGQVVKVHKVFSGPMEDVIYGIKAEGIQEPVWATKQHPFYVFSEEQARCQYGSGFCYPGQRRGCSGTGHGFYACPNKHDTDIGKPSFVEAKDLKLGDCVLLPVTQTVADTTLTIDEMVFLGYYCAEGSLDGIAISFAIHQDEIETIGKDIYQIAEKAGFDPSSFRVYRGDYTPKSGVTRPSKGVSILIRHAKLAELCRTHVGCGAKDKRLSSELMEAPPELQAHFFGAYHTGYGHFHEDSGLVGTTHSKDLATQLRGMGLRLGLVSTVFRYEDRRLKDTDGKVFVGWKVSVPRYACEAILPYTRIDTRYRARTHSSPHFRIEKQWMLHCITGIEVKGYRGYIYNLHVEGEGDQNSFVSGGMTTHNTNPIVGQAIDLLTEIPLSKVRLGKPKCESKDLADQSMAYFQVMCDRLKLFKKLLEITHLFWLDGNVFIFAEDDDTEGKDYKGWMKLVILPPDQVKVTTYSFTDDVDIEFIPSDVDRRTAMGVDMNDPVAIRRSDKIPEEIRKHIQEGRNIPLDTDPSTGSFCFHLARSRRPWEELGTSILERCLRTLLFADKLRQAQTSIASRNMTPKRVVWGENLDENQVDELREQVDLALMDPDFSIVANYQVNWEEYGANDRLLDLSSEYEIVERHLMIGLGVTMELLTGEGTYTGNRLSLEVMNTRFLLFREIIQDYVEEYIFKPVAIRKGFVEKDKWGNEHAVYPKLQFNRLALRDNQDTFESLFQLYQKGSLTIDFILDLFNIDAADVEEKLKKDFATLNDSNFNELVRNALGDAGSKLVEQTDLLEKIVEHLGLKLKPVKEEDRFS